MIQINLATEEKFSNRDTIQPQRQSLDNSTRDTPNMHTT